MEKSDDFDEAKRLIRDENWDGLSQWANGRETLGAGVIRAAIETKAKDASQIDRSVRSFLVERRGGLEKGLTVLATLGANAPFIGLFGTVLGIIQAFGALANNTEGTASVMSGIAEALIATAVGLFVAIPAVVAYNLFSRKLKVAISKCEALRDLYLSRWSAGA